MSRPCPRAPMLALAALIAAAPGLALAWPEVPLPEDSRGEVVTRHMNNNGIEMRASRFSVPRALDEVKAFYHRHWRGQMAEDELDGRLILGHGTRHHYITIELTGGPSHTEGTIGIARLPHSERIDFIPGEGFDRPADTEVLSDVRYLDTPHPSRTLAMFNPHSPFVNFHYFRDRLVPMGWNLPAHHDCRSHSTACIAEFEKAGGRRINLTFNREGAAGTFIVALLQ